MLLVLAGGALTAVVYSPRMDFMCLAQTALHAADSDHAGWSCLHYAAARGDTQTIRHLLAYGMNINQRNALGRTPLAEAARLGQLQAVRVFIAQGAAIRIPDTKSGFTALHFAARNQHPAVLRTLLLAGANPNVHNQWRQTPLWLAAWQAWQGNTVIAHILVEFGATVDNADQQGHTPLHMAARAGNAPMAAYLLAAGAAVNYRDNQGRTPLYQAVRGNHLQAARILLAHGAAPNVHVDGWTPLRVAVVSRYYQLANLLVRYGATGYEQYAIHAGLAAGQELVESQRFDDAVRNLDRVIAMAPNSAQGYYFRGRALLGQGAIQRAVDDLRKALTIAPEHTDTLEWLGLAYTRSGEHRQAVDTLERLIQARPGYGRAHHLLAQNLNTMGQSQRAAQGERTACRLGYRPACSSAF